jgi:hypothetical protein
MDEFESRLQSYCVRTEPLHLRLLAQSPALRTFNRRRPRRVFAARVLIGGAAVLLLVALGALVVAGAQVLR